MSIFLLRRCCSILFYLTTVPKKTCSYKKFVIWAPLEVILSENFIGEGLETTFGMTDILLPKSVEPKPIFKTKVAL